MNCFAKVLLIALIAVSVFAARAPVPRHGDKIKKLYKNMKFSNDGIVNFTPKTLPCEFTINQTCTGVSQGYPFVQDDKFEVHGFVFKWTTDVPDELHEETLYRPDVRIVDTGSDKVFVAMYSCTDFFDPPCTNFMEEEQAQVEAINDNLDWFHGVWEFTDVANATFNDIPCTRYYRYDPYDEADVYLYASNESLIVGLEVFSPDTNETYTLNYTFSAPNSLFVISYEKFVSSINDTRAVKPPVNYDSCNPVPHHSSSSNFAMNNSPAIVVLLIAAALSILLLF